MKNIAKAFVAAQREFEPARKGSENPHFRSKYADLATCVDAVLDALNRNGIGLIQKTHESNDGVVVETVFLHESGEEFSGGRIHIPAGKHDPQGFGSALTYARRYSLLAACGIAPEDDDANLANERYTKKETTAKPSSPATVPSGQGISEKQANLIKARLKQHGVAWEDFRVEHGIEKLSDLPWNRMDDSLQWIEDMGHKDEEHKRAVENVERVFNDDDALPF